MKWFCRWIIWLAAPRLSSSLFIAVAIKDGNCCRFRDWLICRPCWPSSWWFLRVWRSFSSIYGSFCLFLPKVTKFLHFTINSTSIFDDQFSVCGRTRTIYILIFHDFTIVHRYKVQNNIIKYYTIINLIWLF